MTDAVATRDRFRTLHERDLFVLPNPWDVGSALVLERAGAPALATTSAGFAWSLGSADQQVTRDQLVAHVAAVARAVAVPVHVDSERCFADDAAGIAETVGLLAEAGAAGCSIEDYDPATTSIDPIDTAVERVAAAADACRAAPGRLVLTARCEHHLYGIDDLDATIGRLIAYRDAGADCVYAPGLTAIDDIRRVCDAVGVPVNVLLTAHSPSVHELSTLGVRRVSTGGSLAGVAYGSAQAEYEHITREGRLDPAAARLGAAEKAVFGR